MYRKIRQFVLGGALLLAGPHVAADQSASDLDIVTASPANVSVLLENAYVRVLEYVLAPGEQDQWHTHPPKVSYVLSGGQLEVFFDNGTTLLADEKTGTASWADARGKHHVKNIGTTPVRILLVEDKAAAKDAALSPTSPTE